MLLTISLFVNLICVQHCTFGSSTKNPLSVSIFFVPLSMYVCFRILVVCWDDNYLDYWLLDPWVEGTSVETLDRFAKNVKVINVSLGNRNNKLVWTLEQGAVTVLYLWLHTKPLTFNTLSQGTYKYRNTLNVASMLSAISQRTSCANNVTSCLSCVNIVTISV